MNEGKEALMVLRPPALTALLLAVGSTLACGQGGPDAAFDPEDVQTGCDAEHPRAGWTAELETHHHNVSGHLVAVDDCTLELRDFTYDGGGIDVRLVGAHNGDFENGIALSMNLLGEPASGGSLIFPLPTGVTLDDFDDLSIWCVAAGVSFGDGTLQPGRDDGLSTGDDGARAD